MTTWRRLRIVEAEYSERERLLAVAEALRRIVEPTEALRTEAAAWLERLANNEKAKMPRAVRLLATLTAVDGRPVRLRHLN